MLKLILTLLALPFFPIFGQFNYGRNIEVKCEEKVKNFFSRLNILTSSIDVTKTDRDTIIYNLLEFDFAIDALIEDYSFIDLQLSVFKAEDYLTQYNRFLVDKNLSRIPIFLGSIQEVSDSVLTLYVATDKLPSSSQFNKNKLDTFEFSFKIFPDLLQNNHNVKIVKIKNVTSTIYFSDEDGDGLSDSIDKCPKLFGVKELFGCPDIDKDGISDIDDKCPNTYGTKINNGCPEIDSDSDGIVDNLDKCPFEFGTVYGCPDFDNDGIEDTKDKCPNVAGNKRNNGCPDISSNLTVEIPLNFEQLFNIRNNVGILSIVSNNSIKDYNSNKEIFTGKENFLVGIKMKVNRWNKSINYNLNFYNIQLPNGHLIPIKMVLDIVYDSRNKEFDTKSVLFKIKEQPNYFSFLKNN